MAHSKKKYKFTGYTLFILIIAIFSITFFIHFFRWNSDAPFKDKTIYTSLAAIQTFDYSKVTSVESEIKLLESTEAKTTFDASKPLTNAQYKQIFAGNAIIGDSITEGLTAYGYLSEDQVFCKIGASLLNGDELFESSSSTYPIKAFMSFGMNDMLNYRGDSKAFILRYTELIKLFQKISPDTKIYINSISTPSAKAIANTPDLSHYQEFNHALQKMCKDMKITYIDNSNLLKDHPELYAGDGIHVTSEYYPLWINNMIMKAGM